MELTQRIEEVMGEKLGQLSSLPTGRRKGVLNLFYDHLKKGGAWDLTNKELFEFSQILRENGLEEQGEEMFYAVNSVTIQDPEKDYDKLVQNMSEYFADKIANGAILSRGEMGLLAKSNKDVVFDRLFEHNTAYGLGILPSYENPAMRELEAELLQAMQTYQDVGDEKAFRSLRKQLGERADITQLKQVGGGLYTYERRELGAEHPTGGIEFKVAKAIPIEGQRFMPTRVYGYHGILRFYAEEMARISPEGANAFLDGNGILRSVRCGGMWSPIVQGNVLRPIDQQGDQYQIVPVKFFNVEIDKSQKYVADTEEVPCKGGHAWREVVKPSGQSKIVSRSDNVFVVG